MRRLQAVAVCLMVLWLSACSTTSTQGNRAADSTQKALQSYTNLGLQYLNAGDTASAKAPLLHALNMDEGYAPAYHALALVFQQEDEPGLAEEYFRKAVAADSQSAMIHNNFGAFLFAQGRFEQACQELSKAAEDPFYERRAGAYENLGNCYLKLNRPDDAEHAYRRALALSRNLPRAMIALADLLLNKGQNTQASELFGRFRELVDNKRVGHNAASLWVGIRVARHQNDASRAATYGLLLKNLYPDSAEYRLYKESIQ